jgi:flagellar hook-basal body complex protein FliE
MQNIIIGADNLVVSSTSQKLKESNSSPNTMGSKSFIEELSGITTNITETTKNVDAMVNNLASGTVSPESVIAPVSIGSATLEAGMDIISVTTKTLNKILDMQV